MQWVNGSTNNSVVLLLGTYVLPTNKKVLVTLLACFAYCFSQDRGQSGQTLNT